MKTVSSLLLIIACVGSSVGQTPDVSITRGETPGGVEYGIWGPTSDEPASILFMLAGTDRAISLAQAITTASRTMKLDSRVELHVMPEPRGHATPRGSSARAAKWVLEQFNDHENANRDEENAGQRATRPGGREMLFVDDHRRRYAETVGRIEIGMPQQFLKRRNVLADAP